MLSFLTPALLFAQLQINRVFENLSPFVQPLVLTHAGDGSNRIFVAEQRGVIYVFENRDDVATRSTFLDIRARVNDQFSESGFLGLAFHPNYVENGKFYVYYTFGAGRADLASRVSEFLASDDANAADPASERELITVVQPNVNHNAGHMAFGPDSMLYIAFGDGGGANDQYQNGQNRTTLLGSIARIDVDGTSGNLPYAIPNDNPFVENSNGWREEIWAWGLRNPWRFSFDRETGVLWAADVGQGDWEEIDIIERGQNYGWNIMESFHCFLSSNCDQTGLTLPIVEYDHRFGRSVTGGYVYRGSRAPQLDGHYIYGDYISRRIWALRYENGQVVSNSQIGTSPAALSSFGEDEAGELYITGHDNGRIYRFEDPTIEAPDHQNQPPAQFRLFPAYPNPFNPSTAIRFALPQPAFVDISIFDATGRQVTTLVSRQMGSGSYATVWDGRDADGAAVSGGVYFVRFSAAGFRQIQKVALVK